MKKRFRNKLHMNKKNKREYYILAGVEGMKEKMIEAGLDLSPVAFMIIDCNSGIGKLLEEEAIRRVNKLNITKE